MPHAVCRISLLLLMVVFVMSACAGEESATTDDEEQYQYEETTQYPENGPSQYEDAPEDFVEEGDDRVASMGAATAVDNEQASEEVPIAYDDTGAEVAANSLIVTYSEETEEDAKVGIKEEVEAPVVQDLSLVNAESVAVEEGSLEETKAELEAQPGVEAVEYDPIMRFDWYPNDPKARFDGDLDQDNLYGVNAFRAWDYSRGGVTLAIIDSGCRTSHDELDGKIYRQKDIVFNDSTANDTQGHGTRVASVALAETNNSLWNAGGAPSARLICVRVESGSGTVTSSNAMAGVQWAYNMGAKVMNMSFGGFGYSSAFESLLNTVTQRAVVVASAGNTGQYVATRYPISYPGVTGVSGTIENNSTRWTGSSYGPNVNVSAPSQYINYATHACDRCAANGNGTSFGAPMVAAGAAVVWARKPSIRAVEVRQSLQASARDLGSAGRDDVYGYGAIDYYRAVRYAINNY